jgi:hypothetical protein
VVESFKTVQQSYVNRISHGKVSETNQAQNALKTENRCAFPDGALFRSVNAIRGMKNVSSLNYETNISVLFTNFPFFRNRPTHFQQWDQDHRFGQTCMTGRPCQGVYRNLAICLRKSGFLPGWKKFPGMAEAMVKACNYV